MRTEVVARRTFWAAFSGSVGMLIAARASMGIGGAMMMPATLSIITGMFRDPAERQRAIGFWAGTHRVWASRWARSSAAWWSWPSSAPGSAPARIRC